MGVFVLTNPWQTDDSDNSNDGKDPVRQQLKKVEKERDELKSKLEQALTFQRTTTIKEVLAEKRMPAKLAKLIPASIEATPDAITAWLKDYEDLFPTATANETSTTDGTTGALGGTSEPTDQEQVDAMNAALRLAQATTGGRPPASKPEELMAKVNDPNLTREDLVKLIEQYGGGAGVG